MKFLKIFCCIGLLLIISACNPSNQEASKETAVATLVGLTATATEAVVVPTKTVPLPTVSVTTKADPSTAIPPTQSATGEEITFSKTFGGKRRDRGIHVLQTSDEGYAIVGYTSSLDAKQEDIYLVRIDPQGEVLWFNNYGGEGTDNGWDILETEDNGFLILGFTDSFGSGEMDFYLIRIDAAGNLLWDRTYGGPKSEFGWALAPTTDGGYVLAGQTDSFGGGAEDGYLVKVNAQGEEIWSQTFGGPEEDRLFSIDQSADTGFVLTGTTRSFGAGSRDLYLVKTNNSGELVWSQVLGEQNDDVGHTVRQTTDKGYIVTGYTKSYGAKNYDMWLTKFDEEGNLSWQKLFGDPGDDRTIYGEQTVDGGYILTGYTRSYGSLGWDVFLVKTDMSGEVSWHKTFGGNAEDTGYTVRQTADKGFILTGETSSSGEGGGDMLLIKVNQDGDISE